MADEASGTLFADSAPVHLHKDVHQPVVDGMRRDKYYTVSTSDLVQYLKHDLYNSWTVVTRII